MAMTMAIGGGIGRGGITIINVGIDQRRHGKRSIILFMFVVTHINKIDIMFLIII